MSRSYKKSPTVRNSKTDKRQYCSRSIIGRSIPDDSYTTDEFRRMLFDLKNSAPDRARRRFANWETAYRRWLSCYKTK